MAQLAADLQKVTFEAMIVTIYLQLYKIYMENFMLDVK